MNIEGFAFKNNKDVQSIEDIGNVLNIEFKDKKEVFWIDYEMGFHSRNEIIILKCEQSYVIYPSQEILDKKENDYLKMIMDSQEGFTFALSETSMVFMFNWFQQNKNSIEDIYDFMNDGEYEIIGTNKLNLNEDSDIIFDGFFPYLKKFMNDDLANKKALLCSYKIKESKTQEKKTGNTRNYFEEINKLINQEKIEDGFEEIYKIQSLFLKHFIFGGLPPKDYNMDYIRKIPEKKVKNEIKKSARIWQRKGYQINKIESLNIYKVALAWTLYSFKPEDLKRKWWKF